MAMTLTTAITKIMTKTKMVKPGYLVVFLYVLSLLGSVG
jgi:hypothetical protein